MYTNSYRGLLVSSVEKRASDSTSFHFDAWTIETGPKGSVYIYHYSGEDTNSVFGLTYK